jgi:hypothetical protein
MEICVITINPASVPIIILCIYRSSSGNFTFFLNNPDKVLSLYRKPGIEIIVCGDININYMNEKCYRLHQLDTLLIRPN